MNVEPQPLQGGADGLRVVQRIGEPRGVGIGGIADDEGDPLRGSGRVRLRERDEEYCENQGKAA